MSSDAPTASAPTERDSSVHAGFVPTASADHDVSLTTSVAGVVNAQGDAALNQAGAGAIVAGGAVNVSQGGAAAIVARGFTGENVASGIAVANDINVSRGWIGVALSRRIAVSDDSKVLIGPGAALIIAGAMLGVFGIALMLVVMIGRRAMQWRPRVPVPSLSWRRAA